MGKIEYYIRQALIALIKGYQYFISPLFGIGSQCRFHPTCSHYTIDALRTHGVCKGIYLGVARLLKCHPWHHGGVDPVPSTKEMKR